MATQQNTMVSGSGAVENNKHQTLSFPLYVGFKRTPYDTKSYSKPPGQTVFVCVGLTISALNIGFGRFTNVGGGELKQLQAMQTDQAFDNFIHVGPWVQGSPFHIAARGQHPLAYRKPGGHFARYRGQITKHCFWMLSKTMWFSVVNKGDSSLFITIQKKYSLRGP